MFQLKLDEIHQIFHLSCRTILQTNVGLVSVTALSDFLLSFKTELHVLMPSKKLAAENSNLIRISGVPSGLFVIQS